MKDNACRPLEAHEIDLVLTHLDSPRDKALFILGLKSGFRISELLSISIEDTIKKGSIVDRIRVHSSHMKGKRAFREVKLHSEAKQALEPLLKRLSGPLFVSQKGTRLSRSQAWRILTQAFDKAGLEGKLATHSLRKSFSVSVYNASGYDIIKTRDMLGHASITTTNDYLASNRKDLDDLIDKI